MTKIRGGRLCPIPFQPQRYRWPLGRQRRELMGMYHPEAEALWQMLSTVRSNAYQTQRYCGPIRAEGVMGSLPHQYALAKVELCESSGG